MIKKIDRYIIFRLLSITFFVLAVLIFVFVIIHFSDHSEQFTDHGATFAQIFGIYYLNYIPEMVRLVIPVAVFVACLYLTGQMSERFEIAALKAAGVSLYRLFVPYLLFAFLVVVVIFYMDGFIIPKSNAKRYDFVNKYSNESVGLQNNRNIYRQESKNTLMKINYFNVKRHTAYRVQLIKFLGDSIQQKVDIEQMKWKSKSQRWMLKGINKRQFNATGFTETHIDSADTTLNVQPQDLARTTSDIYQLTYPEAAQYIHSLKRSGSGSIDAPKVKFYGRLAYPFSIIVVCFVGFAIACERREGGKGFYIAVGLGISFIYLALIKIIEPFGNQGVLSPALAVAIPHLFFLLIGIGLLLYARK